MFLDFIEKLLMKLSTFSLDFCPIQEISFLLFKNEFTKFHFLSGIVFFSEIFFMSQNKFIILKKAFHTDFIKYFCM